MAVHCRARRAEAVRDKSRATVVGEHWLAASVRSSLPAFRSAPSPPLDLGMCNLPSGILGGISRSLEVFLSRKERRTLWTKIDILFSTFCRHFFALIYLVYILVFTLFSFWQNTLNQGTQTRFFPHFLFFLQIYFCWSFSDFCRKNFFPGFAPIFHQDQKDKNSVIF